MKLVTGRLVWVTCNISWVVSRDSWSRDIYIIGCRVNDILINTVVQLRGLMVGNSNNQFSKCAIQCYGIWVSQ